MFGNVCVLQTMPAEIAEKNEKLKQEMFSELLFFLFLWDLLYLLIIMHSKNIIKII